MNKVSLKQGEKVAKYGILRLIGIGLLKLVAGILTGMPVIIADAINSFADTLGLFASYLGLRLSRKSADKNFKYGYYKIETFAAFIISVGIIYLGYEVLKNAIPTITNPQPAEFRAFAATATIIAIAHSYSLSKSLADAARKTNSLSLMANARDKRVDVIAGIGVMLSIAANYQEVPYVEGIVTTIIGLFILKEGIVGSKESLFFLLDYWNNPKLVRKIRKTFRQEKDMIADVKKLRLRRAGTFIFGEAFVEINPFVGMQDLRETLDLLKEKIEDLDPYIKDFSIYTHISKTKKIKVAVPIKTGKGLKARVASSIKETTAYAFVTVNKNKISEHYTKKLTQKNKSTVALGLFLRGEKVNILIDNKLNSILYYNLRRTHHILIYPNFSDIKSVEDTVNLLLIDS